MNPEAALRKKGVINIAGVDESGRGPLAGPVVAAAVILKEGADLRGLKDSKEIRPQDRRKYYLKIIENSVSIGISIVDNRTIDKKNILRASLYAMKEAVDLLNIKPKHVLVDGRDEISGIKIKQTAVISGDKICRSITAASVIAKVIRDEIMCCYDRLYPNYRFNEHKGYGTKSHCRLLSKHGPAAIHRWSYAPVLEQLMSKGIMFI